MRASKSTNKLFFVFLKVSLLNIIRPFQFSYIASGLEETVNLSNGKVRCYHGDDCVIAESQDSKLKCLIPVAMVRSKISIIGSLKAV